MKNVAIVYMVAGMSSRFGGKIKQFASVGPNSETLIEISLQQAIHAGFTKIIFVVGEKTEEPFKKMFGNIYQGIPIHYAFQSYDKEKRDKPWGTLDALGAARHLIDCPFVICNGDDIYGKNTFKMLADHLRTHKTSATVGYKLGDVLSDKGSVNRGVFYINTDNTVKSLVETFGITKDNLESKGLSNNTLCSMLIFAFHLETLSLLCDLLDKFKKEHEEDRTIESLVPNETSRLIEQGKLIMEVYRATDKWLGVTNPGDEEIVRKALMY